MLAKNIIRINGYKNGKRSHIDVEVKMHEVRFYDNLGNEHCFLAPIHLYDPAQTGFDAGLDAVTSMNRYNYMTDSRMTEKID